MEAVTISNIAALGIVVQTIVRTRQLLPVDTEMVLPTDFAFTVLPIEPWNATTISFRVTPRDTG